MVGSIYLSGFRDRHNRKIFFHLCQFILCLPLSVGSPTVISHCAFLHDSPLSDDPSGKSGLFLKVHFNLPLGIFYFSIWNIYKNYFWVWFKEIDGFLSTPKRDSVTWWDKWLIDAFPNQIHIKLILEIDTIWWGKVLRVGSSAEHFGFLGQEP